MVLMEIRMAMKQDPYDKITLPQSSMDTNTKLRPHLRDITIEMFLKPSWGNSIVGILQEGGRLPPKVIAGSLNLFTFGELFTHLV